MIARLLALPFLAVWILLGVVAALVLVLIVHVRHEREERLPYRTPRAPGLKGKGIRLS